SYAALSYVWGEEQPYSTKTDNIDSYIRGIDAPLIPQTIKDAITTTHVFGIRYLWVDSLCILQDSREDIAREIAQMRDIFERAYLTIIAASAQKVSEGFLQDRPVLTQNYIRLPFFCPDGKVGTIMLLFQLNWDHDHKQEPVNNRAWCLEERLLSPRAMIYTSHTLQYHCYTSTINVGSTISPSVMERLPSMMNGFQPSYGEIIGQESAMDIELANAWTEIIQDYTRRALTKPGDRLLACSGLAAKFGRFWRGKYLAGLWEHKLITFLLWKKDYQGLSPRPTKYRAPSWSWAAIDGSVLLHSVYDDIAVPGQGADVEKCEILYYEVTLENELRPFGQVTGGMLKVRS
ncbi:hypothetical protein M422DRAFT_143567, partial [Sphaerobolus stellatus SS14]